MPRGFRLTTRTHLMNYLDKVREAGDIPELRRMLLALPPWAWRSRYGRLPMRELSAPEPRPDLSELWARWFAMA